MTKDEEIIYANAIKISEAMWDNFRTEPIDLNDLLEGIK
jgi:hypothetical protein